MAKPINLSVEELRQLLRYEPETGRLYWRERGAEWFADTENRSRECCAKIWSGRCAGKEAGTLHARGYIHIRLPRHKNQVKAHRVAFLMANGFEANTVDHINGDPSDNRAENLRSVTQAENAKNCRMWSHNTSGRVGVSWHRGKRKWTAQIRSDGRQRALGTFSTFEEAVAARKAAEREYGYHANHGRAA